MPLSLRVGLLAFLLGLCIYGLVGCGKKANDSPGPNTACKHGVVWVKDNHLADWKQAINPDGKGITCQ